MNDDIVFCIRRNFIFFFLELLHLTTNRLFSKTLTDISPSEKLLKYNTILVVISFANNIHKYPISNCVMEF